MKQRIYLLVFLLGIPFAGFGVSSMILMKFDSDVQTAIRRAHPKLDREQIKRVTALELCGLTEAGAGDFCVDVKIIGFMRSASLISGIVAALLLVAIRYAGKAARNNRPLLVRLFRPGLYITLVVTSFLIFVYAGILVATIYYGESVMINQVHVGIIVVIGLTAIAGVYSVGKGLFSFFKKTEIFAIGAFMGREEIPHFWQMVDSVASDLGTQPPTNIVLGIDGSFYVTEAAVTCLNGKVEGRTLHCSLALCRILTKPELKAIISHELGHFKGDDTQFGNHFSPIYRGTATAIEELSGSGLGISGQLALLPAIALLSYFYESFAVAEKEVSRQRELEADRVAVQATNPKVFATALVKVCAYSGVFVSLCMRVPTKVRNDECPANICLDGYESCKSISSQILAEEVLGRSVLHPLDSHPPLAVRLDSIDIKIEEVLEDARSLDGITNSRDDRDRFEALESTITTQFQQFIRSHLAMI